MFSAVHIRTHNLETIREALVNVAAKRGYVPSDTEAGVWSAMALNNGVAGEAWISVVQEPPFPLKAFSVNMSLETTAPVVGIYIDEPVEWGFWACSGGRIAGHYSWIPGHDRSEMPEDTIRDRAMDRLKDLGVEIPEGNQAFMERKLLRRARHIPSTDPILELKYRSRLSPEEFTVESPCLDPELPGELAALFPERTKARFRKILGWPHLEVGHMAAGFGNYLGILNIFLSYESISKGARGSVADSPCICLQFS